MLLTKERGRISAFARGARRPGSPLLGTLEPFCYGQFSVYEGRTSYTIAHAAVGEYFSALRDDMISAYYGMYFLEVAGYFTREGNDERDMLRHLYYSLHALCRCDMPKRLVRIAFELRAICIYGLMPSLECCVSCGKKDEPFYFSASAGGLVCPVCKAERPVGNGDVISGSALYALRYIISVPPEKLYTFTVAPEVEEKLHKIVKAYYREHVEKKFLSLEMIELLAEDAV